jgi:chemotaxis protein MotB
MAILRKLERPEDQLPEVPVKRKKKKQVAPHDESNWLISYADMMTLLCVFYIMMFSMSKVNTQEFEKVKKQVAEHLGAPYKSPTEDLGKFVTQVIQENGVSKDVTISSDGTSVSLAFHSTLFFGSSSADISNEGKLIIDRIAHGLYQEQTKLGKNYKIVIEGHTDAVPMTGVQFPSNWELSSARATRVIRLFLDDGFQAQNLLAIGYADTQPIAESRNSDGSWNSENLAKNRRVIMRVLLPEIDSIPWTTKPTVDQPVKTLEGNKPIVEPDSAQSIAPAGAVPVKPAQMDTTSSEQAALTKIAPTAPTEANPSANPSVK